MFFQQMPGLLDGEDDTGNENKVRQGRSNPSDSLRESEDEITHDEIDHKIPPRNPSSGRLPG
jgi:hypothetical protein